MAQIKEIAEKSFSTPHQRYDQFLRMLSFHVEGAKIDRVLDLGCGTGGYLFELSEVFPGSELVGVDLSEASIDIAEQARSIHPAAGRLRFAAEDYLQFSTEPFDLIISESTLQNIDAATNILFNKIRDDLSPGGLIAFTIPYNCFFNRCLWTVRKVFRLLRSPYLDRLVLALAKLLHRGGDYNEEMLSERLIYMYLLPFTSDSPAFRELLMDDVGLEFVEEKHYPHVSMAQPKHRFLVFRKPAF